MSTLENNKQDTSVLRQRKSSSTTNQEASLTPEEQPTTKRYKQRKQLPSVADLLAYGPEENEGKPKTWGDIFCLPVTLAVVFAISLLIFHHAPHHLSKRRSHQLPMFVQQLQEQRLERNRKRHAESRVPLQENMEPFQQN